MDLLKKKIILFGKSNKDVRSIKQNFIDQNDLLLRKSNLKGKIYKSQKIRNLCKACGKKLKGSYFISHLIKYILCNSCTHLNGNFQDSEAFANKIYLSKKINYSKNYNEEKFQNYLNRVKKIYIPKAKFLKQNFKNYKKIKILDIGSGSGYFLSALSKQGFPEVRGIEISNDQVKYGKKMLSKQNIKPDLLLNMKFSNIMELVKCTKFNCISVIGVLEHLTQMREFLKNIKNNKNIKFIYLSVPLFSFTCIFESVFDKVNNRHLAGSHTHLFTEKSLKRLFREFSFKPHSEWWFGLDFNDLYRSINVMSNKKKNSGLDKMVESFYNMVDEFQIAVDKKKMSSEVHILFKR